MKNSKAQRKDEMLKRGLRLLLVGAIVGLLYTASAAPALGQCAMCRASLAGANDAFVRHLNLGVAVLLVPPVSIFCTIFILAFRHRKSG